jgi:hypothetical protein
MPGHDALRLARLYYAGAGLAAAGIVAFQLVNAFTGGCRIAFAQADMETGTAMLAGSCVQYVDPVLHGVLLAVAAVLATTAVAFGRRGLIVRPLVLFGAVVGIGAAYFPAAIIWWLVNHRRETPLGMLEVAITAAPFVIPLAVAWVTWRAHRRPA